MKDLIKRTSAALWNGIKALGPTSLFYSKKASEAWAQHKAREGLADVLVEATRNEIHSYEETRRLLFEKYYSTDDPMERLRIEGDIEHLSRSRSVHSVVSTALGYIADRPSVEPNAEINDHWLDQFRQFACQRNEPWRTDLLARVLAAEALAPATVSPRLVWLIGTLEEAVFVAFAELLSVCSSIDDRPIIPALPINEELLDGPISSDNETSVKKLWFRLTDSQLLAPSYSYLQIAPGETILANDGKETWEISCDRGTDIRGLLLTPIGSKLASFCDTKPAELGRRLFKDWLNAMRTSSNTIKKM